MNKEQALAFLVEAMNDYIRSLPPSAGKALSSQASMVLQFIDKELYEEVTKEMSPKAGSK